MTVFKLLPGAPLLAAAALALTLGGCAMHDRPDTAQAAPYPAAASTPAIQPDRQTDRPRSFSDPGPMYPDTGR